MDFIKREKKFLIVLAITLALAIGFWVFAIGPVRGQAGRDLTRAQDAERQLVGAMGKSFGALKVPEPEKQSLKSLTDANRKKVDLQNESKATLISHVGFIAPPQFALQPGFEPAEITGYKQVVDNLIKQLRNKYRDSPDYLFVRSPDLTSPTLKQDLAFDVYLPDAKALAGVAKPQDDNEFSLPGSGGDTKDDEPSDAAQKAAIERATARAQARLELLMLNMVSKIVESGREAQLSRVESMAFIARDNNFNARFRVNEKAPCFYRPVKIQLDATASEANLMKFLDLCVMSAVGPVKGQFLALDEFTLQADECLDAAPKDDLVTARVVFIAYLVDQEQPLIAEEADKADNRVSRPWRMR